MSVWNFPGIILSLPRTKKATATSIAMTTQLVISVLVMGIPRNSPSFSADMATCMPFSMRASLPYFPMPRRYDEVTPHCISEPHKSDLSYKSDLCETYKAPNVCGDLFLATLEAVPDFRHDNRTTLADVHFKPCGDSLCGYMRELLFLREHDQYWQADRFERPRILGGIPVGKYLLCARAGIQTKEALCIRNPRPSPNVFGQHDVLLSFFHVRTGLSSGSLDDLFTLGRQLGLIITHRRKDNHPLHTAPLLRCPVHRLLTTRGVPSEVHIFYTLLLSEIDCTLDVVNAISKDLVNSPRPDIGTIRPSHTGDLVVSTIVKHDDSSFFVYKLIGNFKFAEHRTSEPMHPYDYPLRFLGLALRSFSGVGAEPQAVEHDFLRGGNLNMKTRPHWAFLPLHSSTIN